MPLDSGRVTSVARLLRSRPTEPVRLLSKLKVVLTPRGAFVVVVVPSALLARGDYQARLSGSTSPGEWTDIATYTFRVSAADGTTSRPRP